MLHPATDTGSLDRRAALLRSEVKDDAASMCLGMSLGNNLGHAAQPLGSARDVRLKSVHTLLELMSKHSKSRRTTTRSSRLFVRNIQISCLVAGWVVFLTLPAIIWPVGKWMRSGGCHHLGKDGCESAGIRCVWRPPEGTRNFSSCIARGIEYLNLWGTMLLQFIFSIGPDFGSTVQYTLQGLIGTFLAYLNMLLLNNVMWFFLGGGAGSDPLWIKDKQINSNWLPLCSNGMSVLNENDSDFCLFNIWWGRLSFLGISKVSIVMFDFHVFVLACLTLGLDANTRMFALSTHVYFVMAFVDPSQHGFLVQPHLATNYFLMILAASCIALLAFNIPKPRFSAFEAAEQLCTEAVEAVSVLVESLHGAPSELIRQKARSASSETNIVLSDLDKSLAASWFEGVSCRRLAEKRRKLCDVSSCLKNSIAHIPRVFDFAAAVPAVESQQLEASVRSLSTACAQCGQLLAAACGETISGASATGEVIGEMRELLLTVMRDFNKLGSDASSASHAFVFVVCGTLFDVVDAICTLRSQSSSVSPARASLAWHQRLGKAVVSIRDHFGLKLVDRSATHPRFVLRYTLSISVAFCVGWLGLWNILPAYSSYAAGNICLILYTYISTSTPVTIRRVAGVVLGKVLGNIIKLGLAVQVIWKTLLFAFALWFITGSNFFFYLHAPKDAGYVACLTAAFAASSMIPYNIRFREWGTSDRDLVSSGLLNDIMGTVIGISIMTVFDLLLASSPAGQARQHLLRAFSRAKHILRSVQSSAGHEINDMVGMLMHDLDMISDLVPYASDEPAYFGRPPFKSDLYRTLQKHLRAVGCHLATLTWASQPNNSWEGTPWVASLLDTMSGEGNTHAGPSFLKSAQAQRHFEQLIQEVYTRLAEIQTLCASVVMQVEDEEEGANIRRQLQETLYTSRIVRSILTGPAYFFTDSRSLAGLRSAESPRPVGQPCTPNSPHVPPCPTSPTDTTQRRPSRLRLLRDTFAQFIAHERFFQEELELLPQSTQRCTWAVPVDDIIENFYTAAKTCCQKQQQDEEVGSFVDSCRVDTVTCSLKFLLTEIQQMQFALLEY